MDLKNLSDAIIGLSLFNAKKKMEDIPFEVEGIRFIESDYPRLTVIGVDPNKKYPDKISLIVSGTNPIDFLPAIYQNNDFLHRFLWIIQHMHYETVSILDNLNTFFTPMEAPDDFINWIGSWFNVSKKLNLNPEKMRMFLQNALMLYRWRGTKIGMEKLVHIVTGVIPEIYENEFPLSEYILYDNLNNSGTITDEFEPGQNFFTVHIPVIMDELSTSEKVVIYELIKQERPINAMFCLTFKNKNQIVNKGSLIDMATVINESGVSK